jgi:hypothetical protein
MIFAIKDGERITAQPQGKAICPSCGQAVIAKCGAIKMTTLGFVSRQLYLDIGNGLLLKVVKLDFESPCAGWGYLTNYKAFTEEIIKAGSA